MSAHGRISLEPDTCTSCMLCVRECPTWCIRLQAHQEVVADAGGRRPRTVNVLDSFAIDWGLCMYCGLCVDVCPVDALHWGPDAVPATSRAGGLVHGISQLSAPRPGGPPGAGPGPTGS